MNVHDFSTLSQAIAHHAASKPGHPAVFCDGQTQSFAELQEHSARVANGLEKEPAGNQRHVAYLARNRADYFEVLFGAMRSNRIFLPINWRLAAAEIEFILGDAEAPVLFLEPEYVSQIESIRERLPHLRKLIVLGDSYVHWRDANAAVYERDNRMRDVAVQMYTSGTAGNPKGVMLSHYAMNKAAVDGLSVWPWLHVPAATTSTLGIMPLFHIAAANLSLATIYVGATACITNRADPASLCALLTEREITMVPLPPALIHGMLQLPGIERRDFSHLKCVLVAGSAIAVELLRQAKAVLRCGFALSYGSTELCGGVTFLPPEDCTIDRGKLLESAGLPFADAQVKIVDADGGERPRGVVGEILCRTTRVMNGYWNSPAASAEVLLRDGWYASGDAGYIDKSGYLFVVDRIKDMVISGGENIYPAEIEKHLHLHPDIALSAVIGVPDEKWGESLLACVATRSGTEIPADDLIAFLRDRIAGYKIPRRFRFIREEAFPRNASGKILKRKLREQLRDG